MRLNIFLFIVFIEQICVSKLVHYSQYASCYIGNSVHFIILLFDIRLVFNCYSLFCVDIVSPTFMPKISFPLKCSCKYPIYKPREIDIYLFCSPLKSFYSVEITIRSFFMHRKDRIAFISEFKSIFAPHYRTK
jgi:hypothetical protein